MKKLLRDTMLFKLLEKIDEEEAERAREGRCLFCGARVHLSKYLRQAVCGPSTWKWRWSFCCERDGCRKRKTPVSVRFLGRRAYVSVVVVLVSAMMHGWTEKRVERVRQELGIDEHTMKRWRQWWLEVFVNSRFWKESRARFMPGLDETRLPLSLVKAFGARRRDGLIKLLKFLRPLTTTSCPEVGVM